MEKLSELLSKRVAPEKTRRSERGDLLAYFAEKLGKPVPYVAFKVAHLKELKDLYYLKSTCDLYERDGNPWSKGFYGALK